MSAPAGERSISAFVDEQASQRKTRRIDATSPERFVIVTSKLFEISQKRICAYSDHFCRQSTDNPLANIAAGQNYWSDPRVISSACTFLESPDSSLEIIVGKKLDSLHLEGLTGHEFIRSVVAHKLRRGSLLIYIASNNRAGKYGLAGPNFVVADDNGNKIETSSIRQNSFATFGQREVNEELFATFDLMKQRLDEASAYPQPNGALRILFRGSAKEIANPTVISPYRNLREVPWDQYLMDQSDPRQCPKSSILSELPARIAKVLGL